MGKSTPSVPKAPDPAATAAAQAAANKETAIAQSELNMVNQNTPFGSLTYEQRGTSAEGTPQYTATTTLSPEQQQILDQTNQAGIKFAGTANNQLDAVSQRLSSPLDFSSLGAAPVANEQTRLATRDAIVQRAQPEFDRQREQMYTQLVNQGFEPGSQAFGEAYDRFNTGRNDFLLAADQAAGNEMSRMFGLESTARDRAINEMVQQRAIPLNELSAMLSGAQVQGPSFVSTPQTGINPADIMGATYASYNGDMNAYNAKLQQNNATNQGLFGLLGTGVGAAFGSPWVGTALGWSDVRLKRDITHLGGGLYRYRYIWSDDWHVGVMAQEVLKTRPQAVHMIGGFLAVDYGALA